MRERERQMGSGFGFGIFFEGRFCGEITLSSIQRGPFQNGFIGYWIDEDMAGSGLIPEAVVVVLQFAFETLRLHRIEVAIIPRNEASRRVVEKLGLRDEGVAVRYLEIDGDGRTTSATPSPPRSGPSGAPSCGPPGSSGADRPPGVPAARAGSTCRQPRAHPAYPSMPRTTAGEWRKNCSTSCS